jgi:hypothetical protein
VGNGVKQQGCEADHEPAASAEHKNALSYIATPPNLFMVCTLIIHRYLFQSTYLFKLRGRCKNCNFTTFGCALGILYGWYSRHNKHVALATQTSIAGVSFASRIL